MASSSRMALDKSVRTVDADGRLHVAITNISKANVCPYLGREIPDWQTLGLDPDKTYRLYRDPGELRKAAPTFNNIPLLSRHAPVSVDDHQPDLVVGATGTDAVFEAPFLRNSLVVWKASAIAGINSAEQRELSSAYRYRADMTPGVFEGAPYDGVMRDIIGNHVALVETGRAGPDVVVGDALSAATRNDLADEDFAVPGKRRLPIENAKHAREAWDLLSDTDGLSPEEVTTARERILRAAKKFDIDTSAWTAPKGANDSKEPVTMATRKAALSHLAATAKKTADDMRPKIATDAALAAVVRTFDKIALDAARARDEAKEDDAVGDEPLDFPGRPASPAKDEDETEEERKAREAEEAADKKARDEDPDAETDEERKERLAKRAADKRARDADPDDDKDAVKKPAMDAAIAAACAAAAKAAEASTIARLNGIQDAREAVAPYVGKLAIACDSADAVYKAALDVMKVDVAGVHPSAYRAILAAQPKPGEAHKPRVAMDADADISAFSKRFPDAPRVKHL